MRNPEIFPPSLTPRFSGVILGGATEKLFQQFSDQRGKLLKQFPVLRQEKHPAKAGC